MTRTLPRLGSTSTRDGSSANTTQSHECHHCGQQLPEQMLKHNATVAAEPKQTPQSTLLFDHDVEKSGTMKEDSEPEMTMLDPLPESSSSTHDIPAASTSSAEPQHLPQSNSTGSAGPEMWLADCLSAIEHKVGDFITHFDSSLAEPKSKAPEYAARDAAANPPSYDTAARPASSTTPASPSIRAARERLNSVSPARNAQAVMKGHFHKSSHSMELKDGHILSARCADPHGKHFPSSIDLNDCLTNNNGKLQWCRGGNFKATARNAKLSQDGKCLEVEIRMHDLSWQWDKFDLSERIENRNGKLVYLPAGLRDVASGIFGP